MPLVDKSRLHPLASLAALAFCLAACSPQASSPREAASSSAGVAEAPPSWRWSTDPVSGKSLDKAEMWASIETVGNARMTAGCSGGQRQVSLSFFQQDGTPMNVADAASDQIVDSRGETQTFSPGKDGSNSVTIVLKSPPSSVNPTFGEVQEGGIPKLAKIALPTGTIETIDLRSGDPIFQQALSRCVHAN